MERHQAGKGLRDDQGARVAEQYQCIIAQLKLMRVLLTHYHVTYLHETA